MKVVALNSSPRMSKGVTATILSPFLLGMSNGGADVSYFDLAKMDIHPCSGEWNCWIATPGICYQKDDMAKLLPHLREADVWVLATPLYWDGMSGILKNTMDRMTPLVEPFVEVRDGRMRHPRRSDVVDGKVVLVSSCGFWEPESFEPLVAHVKAFCGNVGREYAGALLRPHSTAVRTWEAAGHPPRDVYTAATEAGYKLATEGKIPEENMEKVASELVSQENYVRGMNANFGRAIENFRVRHSPE